MADASGSGRVAEGSPVAFLDAQKAAHPEVAEWYSEMGDLYERKLWHQLTLKLEQFLAHVCAAGGSPGAVLIPLYQNFISDIAARLNTLKLAHFAVTVSRHYAEPAQASSFLDSVSATIQGTPNPSQPRVGGLGAQGAAPATRQIQEAVVYVSMQQALLKLQTGDQRGCKQLLDQARATLDSLQGGAAPPALLPPGSGRGVSVSAVGGAGGEEVDPSVQASVFWVQSQYFKSRQDYAEFYRSALLYLAYTPPASLTPAFKLDLAVDLALAALLGENVYNFGELLAHPVVGELEASPFVWLLRMLEVFEKGDLKAYDALCRQHQEQLSAQPALVTHQQGLRDKITVLCLLNLITERPAEERNIPLSDIAQRTGLAIEGVEHLLMKSLSAKLVEGVIDQVDSTVQVSWVQPRVLNVSQVASLKNRLDSWLDRVHSTLLAVEAETPELLVA